MNFILSLTGAEFPKSAALVVTLVNTVFNLLGET
jgi:hypothetical protein